jgi:hypothetical protein
MADERLRILLQQYQATRDPQDAVRFAENYLRVEGAEPATVWVCDIVMPDEGTNVEIFLTQIEALTKAATWCLEEALPGLEEADGGDEAMTPRSGYVIADLRTRLEAALRKKNSENLIHLIRMVNRELPEDIHVAVASQDL